MSLPTYAYQRVTGAAVFSDMLAAGGGGEPAVAGVFVKIGGSYIQADSVHVKVSGTYRLTDEIHIKQAGVYAPL